MRLNAASFTFDSSAYCAEEDRQGEAYVPTSLKDILGSRDGTLPPVKISSDVDQIFELGYT